MAESAQVAPRIEESILLIRGHRVMLDQSLAALYGVPTKVLVQAVKRNRERFPEDFMFQLTNQELAALRSQSVTSNAGRGGRRYVPYAFSEQGVAMLSSVLRSRTAVAINIEVMRVFVRLRQIIAVNKDFARKFAELETQLATHDRAIARIFESIRQLMKPPAPRLGRRIGFV